MDLITYALCKKKAASAVSGVKSYTVEGQTLKITLNDGSTLDMVFPDPNGISSMVINSSNHLIVTLDNGTTIDCGEVPAGTSRATISVKVVSELPTTDIDESSIYMLHCVNAEGQDNYDEYMYVDGSWERLGNRDSAVETITDEKNVTDNTEIDDIF